MGKGCKTAVIQHGDAKLPEVRDGCFLLYTQLLSL